MADIVASPSLSLVDISPTARHPWVKFYTDAWLADELLVMCSMSARGLLVAFMCLMHRAKPYGYLLVGGKKPTDAELTRLVRATGVAEVRRLKQELLDRGVLSATSDGIIYSRRLVRMAVKSATGREHGRRGGNPQLKPPTPLRVVEPSPLTLGDNTQKTEVRGQNPLPPAGVVCDEELEGLARQFLEAYPQVYAKCRAGAFIRLREARDFTTALELVHDYQPLDRLLAMLEVFLRRTDTGEMGKPGSPRQFQRYAPDCDRVLREHGR